MSQNEKNESRGSLVTAACVVGCYLVMYGLMVLFMDIVDHNTVVFLIFLAICIFFTYKSCKGKLSDTLSFLPWPAFIVLLFAFSAIIGCFTAPYHIGKWIAQKINKALSKKQSTRTSPESPTRTNDEIMDDLVAELAKSIREEEASKK